MGRDIVKAAVILGLAAIIVTALAIYFFAVPYLR